MTAPAVVTAVAVAGWRTSSWSGTHPEGNCVQVAAIPSAGGVCTCGGDPDCGTCRGTGTVWI